MLTVIGVIGALAAITVIAINPAKQIGRANDAKRKADLAQIQRALEAYYNDKNAYPPSSGTFLINSVSWGNSWTDAVTGVVYMSRIPQDPTSVYRYVYYSPSPYQTYYLYASLEAPEGTTPCQGGTCPALSGVGVPVMTAACGATSGRICNYGVTSSNISL